MRQDEELPKEMDQTDRNVIAAAFKVRMSIAQKRSWQNFVENRLEMAAQRSLNLKERLH